MYLYIYMYLYKSTHMVYISQKVNKLETHDPVSKPMANKSSGLATTSRHLWHKAVWELASRHLTGLLR